MSWLRSWERNERRAGDGGMDAERRLLVPEQVSHWVGTYLFLAVIPWPTRSVFNPTIHPGKSFWVDESPRAGQKITGMSSAFTNEAKMQHLCCFTSYCIWGMAASPFFFWLLIKPTIWRKWKGHFSWFSNIIHETKGAIYNQEDKTDCKQQLSTPSLHPSIHRSRVDSAHPELTHFNFFIVCFGTVDFWCAGQTQPAMVSQPSPVENSVHLNVGVGHYWIILISSFVDFRISRPGVLYTNLTCCPLFLGLRTKIRP